jgi:hypothetical protein
MPWATPSAPSDAADGATNRRLPVLRPERILPLVLDEMKGDGGPEIPEQGSQAVYPGRSQGSYSA